MEVQKKSKTSGIERLLIADDTPENLDAAKKYFSTINLKTDYAKSEEEAKEMIISQFETGEKYDFVITDLEMEDRISGCNVLSQAYKYGAEGTIATGRDYHKPDSAGHGPYTSVYSIRSKPAESLTVKAKKTKPEVWKKILDGSLELVKNNSGLLKLAISKNKALFSKIPLSDEAMILFNMLIYDRAAAYGWCEFKSSKELQMKLNEY